MKRPENRPMTEERKARLLASREWNRIAKRRTAHEWRVAVDAVVPHRLRIEVACIVWWDFFGGHMVSDGWTDLDVYKHAWRIGPLMDVAAVAAGLMQAGYPAWVAERRARYAANTLDVPGERTC